MKKRKSIYMMSGLPSEFGASLLIFALILTISPYMSGQDFGVFRVPQFSSSIQNSMKIYAPIFLFISCFLFIPIISTTRIKIDKVADSESGLKLVDVVVLDNEDGSCQIDLKVRNIKDEVIIIKEVDCEVSYSTVLNSCDPVPISALVISGEYHLLLKPSDQPYVSIVKTSQVLQPNSADRFSINIESAEENAIYLLKLLLLCNENGNKVKTENIALFYEDLLTITVPYLDYYNARKQDKPFRRCVKSNIKRVSPMLDIAALHNSRMKDLADRVSEIERASIA